MVAQTNSSSERRVRFSDEILTITVKRQRHSETRWISRQHLQKISKHVQSDAEECKRKLDDDNHLSKIFDLPVRDRIDMLVRMNQDNQCIRGLERHVSQEHRRRVRRIQQETIITVLSLQERLRATRVAPQRIEQQLAKESQELSHNAKVFARILALSDQRVVREEEEAAEAEKRPLRKSESNDTTTGPRRRLSDMLQRHSFTAVPLPRLSSFGRKRNSTSKQQQQQQQPQEMLLPMSMPTMAAIARCNSSGVPAA